MLIEVGEEISIQGTQEGVFLGPGQLIEKFPRLDITTITQRDQAWPE